MIVLTLLTWGVAWLELEYLKLPVNSRMRNLITMHNLLGFAISMLLVFRTNTAYDRWWEGRKLWGALVNNSRNLAIKLNSMLDEGDRENRKFFKKSIPLYAAVPAHHLQSEKTRLALDEQEHSELNYLDKNKHLPNQVASAVFKHAYELKRKQIISGEELLVLNTELTAFTDICGACERIKNTPIPLSYSVFLKKFIFVYVLTLPLSLVLSLGYMAIPVVLFVFYVLTSLELIAEEIEDPFGSDHNDLPTLKMADNIKKHVSEIL